MYANAYSGTDLLPKTQHEGTDLDMHLMRIPHFAATSTIYKRQLYPGIRTSSTSNKITGRTSINISFDLIVNAEMPVQ